MLCHHTNAHEISPANSLPIEEIIFLLSSLLLPGFSLSPTISFLHHICQACNHSATFAPPTATRYIVASSRWFETQRHDLLPNSNCNISNTNSMAREDAATMSRAPSVDSSAPSTIQVAHTLDEDTFSDRVPASTPPTSLAESNSTSGSVKGSSAPFQAPAAMPTVDEEQTGGRRTRRARASVNYNLVHLMNAQVVESANASRNVSASQDVRSSAHLTKPRIPSQAHHLGKRSNKPWTWTGRSRTSCRHGHHRAPCSVSRASKTELRKRRAESDRCWANGHTI